MVNLDRIGDVVGSGGPLALADSAATRSMTLPRDRDGLIPADPRRYRRVLHVVYARDADLTAGQALGVALGAYFPEDHHSPAYPGQPGFTTYQDLAWTTG